VPKNGDDQLLELLVALPSWERQLLEPPHQLDVAADCLPGIGDPEADEGKLQLVADERRVFSRMRCSLALPARRLWSSSNISNLTYMRFRLRKGLVTSTGLLWSGHLTVGSVWQ
jgi:hypothetical protein